jgi:hypothetical protein
MNALTQEWVTLQNNHEQHERSALVIKLVALLLFVGSVVWPHPTTLLPGVFFALLCFVQGVLWLQEAILRTSQARLAERLLRIEALQRTPSSDPASALQLHSEWQASRKGTLGLLGEYARHALRPTVAFPHALLIAVLAAFALCH